MIRKEEAFGASSSGGGREFSHRREAMSAIRSIKVLGGLVLVAAFASSIPIRKLNMSCTYCTFLPSTFWDFFRLVVLGKNKCACLKKLGNRDPEFVPMFVCSC